MSESTQSVVRVFLCSTYEDLVDERKAVLASLDELQLAHESMEYFGARSSPAIEACLAEVAKSSVLILIVGHRYGSLVPGQEVSFTEAEYQEGHRLKKPCLIYMRHDDVAVLPRFFESDPAKLSALRAFRSVLNDRHTVARFRTRDDLAGAVRTDIGDTVRAVESQVQNARNSDKAFFAELQELARIALANGHKETLLLSAFRTAIASLAAKEPTFVQRLVTAARALVSWRPVFARAGAGDWVFFSYAQADLAAVTPVAHELRRYGLSVWLDQQQLVPGNSLVDGIKEGLHKAKALVFFASKRSLESQWARHELDYFMARRVTSAAGPALIPVILEDVNLPGVLRDVLYLDMRNTSAREIALRVAAAVRRQSVNELRALSLR